MKRRRTLGTAWLMLAALTTVACSDDDPEPTTFTAVTYNGGLAVGFVSGSNERSELTSAAVGTIEADVICVQEFWLPSHVDELKAATKDAYPHQLFVTPDPGATSTAACTPADTTDLLQCVSDNGCDAVCADELVNCALINCGAEVQALPEDCQNCVAANIGQELDDIVASCEGEASEYLYGGSFGIGLLSKHPIVADDSTVFTSHINRRAVIHAQLDSPIGEVHAYCTHLTAVFEDKDGDGEPDIPFPGSTGSWEEEQATQVTEMISLANSQAAGKQVILLGDLNNGPAGPGYEAEVPENYQFFVDDGYTNPYITTAGHTCTYCTDNPIIADGSADDESPAVIDHVLLKGFTGTATGTRVLDSGIDVTVCEKNKSSAYSDHYGVSVLIEP